MNAFLLYLILLKGTVTAFAGLASLPVIQDAVAFQYHVLTDQQLNEAVAITRSTPGPVGLYIVSVGYFVAGVRRNSRMGRDGDAFAADHSACPLHRPQDREPCVKGVLHTIVIASAGLLFASAIPLARDALTDPLTIGIAAATLVLMLLTEAHVSL
jgi:chromate transporter